MKSDHANDTSSYSYDAINMKPVYSLKTDKTAIST